MKTVKQLVFNDIQTLGDLRQAISDCNDEQLLDRCTAQISSSKRPGGLITTIGMTITEVTPPVVTKDDLAE